MKKLLLFILITSSIHFFAQQTYVPDDNFEQALISLGYDDVLDNYVLTTNISSISHLGLSAKNISDLTGIEDFVSLEFFSCRSNQITSVNISNNTLLISFLCWDNQITSLDVSNLSSLFELDCAINQLEFLDVRNGNNLSIDYFNAEFNPNLTCIFVDDAAWSTANWQDVDPASTFVETQAECDALGIYDEFLLQNVQIYPNPIVDQLFINGNHLNILSIHIYDVIGKLVTQEFNNYEQIDVSNLNQGVYLVKIKTDKGIISKKIIKL